MKTNVTREYIEELAYKYKQGTLSQQESAFFEDWYSAQIDREVLLPEGYAADHIELKDRMFSRLTREMDKHQQINNVKPFRFWRKTAIAASLFIALFIGGYMVLQPSKVKNQYAEIKQPDILPGDNRAILTLSDGKQINLTSAPTGIIAAQAKIAINKTVEGKIIYNELENAESLKPIYNTVSTPRGGRFSLKLSDGTGVWLNAGSSITYPVHFSATERMVETSGEVYFEVSHDRARPFRVVCDGQTIEVLGTHFNVNSYRDEPSITTTLIEGRVKVYNQDPEKYILLSPGKAARNDKSTIQVSNADAEAAVAWKDNQFQFSGSDLKTIMREFSRWYDVDVEYRGRIPEVNEFTGRISRNVKASKIFQILKRYHIEAKIEGKKVIVTSESN